MRFMVTMNYISRFITFTLVFYILMTKVHCQDDEEEEEEEPQTSDESTTLSTKSESGNRGTSGLSSASIANLTKALQANNNGSAVDPGALNVLLLAAIANSNTAAESTTPAPTTTEEPSSTTREEYIVRQVSEIMASVGRGNISGIVDNALRIGAPKSVQALMMNVLTFLNNFTGGVFGLGRPTASPSPDTVRNSVPVSCGAAPAAPIAGELRSTTSRSIFGSLG